MSHPSTLELHRENEARPLDPGLGDLRALTRVLIEISRSLDLENVLQASLDGIRAVVNGDAGCFLLLQTRTPPLYLASASTLPPLLREQLVRLTFDPRLDPAATSEDRIGVISRIGQGVREILLAQAIESFVLIPLTALGRPVGVLLVLTCAGSPPRPPSVGLLMSIGEQVGRAIDNARLHTSVRESEEWRRTFMENSPDAFWEGDFQGRITYANDAACKLIGRTREELLGMRIRDFTLEAAESRHAAAVELRQKGFLVDRETKIVTKSGEIRTVNYATRVVRDRQGKVVRFQSISHDTTEQQKLLAALRHRNEELAALNEIANILSHPLDVVRSLDLVCEQITSITGMEGAAIYLVDEAQPVLNLIAYRGLSDSLVNQGRQLGLDDPLTRRIVVEGEPIAMDDMMAYAETSLAGPRQEGYRAGIAVPILKQNAPIGGIFVGSKVRAEYERSDINLLLNVGKQIGQAAENANLIVQMQRRVQELDGLAKLSAACAASLEPRAVSELAVEWTQKLLEVDLASLRLLEGKELFPIAVKAVSPEFAYSGRISLEDRFDQFVQLRSPLIANDLTKEPSPLEGWLALQHGGLRALLLMPLSARDRVIGAITVAHSHAHVWSQREIDLLQTIANQTANAIHNAVLFQNVLSEQRKVEAIFDSGLSGLYATDVEGRIVMFNRAAERVTGWTRGEVQGQTWQEIFGDAAPLIGVTLESKEPAYDPTGRELKTRDGRTIPVAEAAAPLFDEKGQVNGAVGAFWDLTREQAAELSRERFLRLVAHQLRSPLTALLSARQLLDRPGLSRARRAELWGIVKSDGERLRKFADEFLDLEAAIKSPRPVQWEALPIAALARKLVHAFKTENHGHRFRVQACRPEPAVYADPDRVEHVLRNLLDNAATYSPVGSLVTVSIRPLDDATIDVAVQDQGEGIPLEDRGHIFEPFYRSSRSTERRTYGHGLGLSIAQTIVREMGGEIWVEGKKRGTVFHFTLRRTG